MANFRSGSVRWLLMTLLALGMAVPIPTVAPAADNPLQVKTLAVGGAARTYAIVVPPGDAPKPLVIALHGAGGSGAGLGRSTGLIDKALAERFILVLPDGTSGASGIATWNAGGCCGVARASGTDDVGYIRALIDETERAQRVDRKRIYVVGLSNGGMLAHKVAIALGDRLAGVAVYVGALFGDEARLVAPVPMLLLNADKDDRVPVAGGTSTTTRGLAARHAPYLPSRDAALFWAKANRCRTSPARRETADYVLETWRGCASGADVDFYVTKDAGHGWPGRATVRTGPGATGRIDGTDLIWTFFSAHHR